MWLATLKSLTTRKLRLALVSMAVVLGVAFISGTLVFTDSISNAFEDLFTQSYANTDVTVNARAAERQQHNGDFESTPTRMPESLIKDIQDIPGVSEVDGAISGIIQVVGKDGDPIGGHGPPTILISWMKTRKLSALHIAKGRAPVSAQEMAIDVSTAERNKLKIGDTVQVLFRRQDAKFKIVGLAGFGKNNQTLGATLVIFERKTAQQRLDAPGKLDLIDVSAKSGVSSKTLRKRIDAVLPNEYVVRTGSEQASEQLSQINEELQFVNFAMLSFAFISLFVGAFIIFNTFSITVAQRSRELGLYRALGATRKQVRRMVYIEGLVVGIIASLIGLVSGVGVAYLIRSLIKALAGNVPSGNLELQMHTVILSLSVGIVVTLLASIIPAFRASRVSPLEAMRNATVEARNIRKRAIAIGAIIVLIGAGLITSALTVDTTMGKVGIQLGIGFVVLVIGTAVLAPLLVRPLVAVVGYPIRAFGSITGKLACENAIRNPRRTAATAAALMIGIALVSFASIFTESLSSTFTNQIDKAFVADYTITSKAELQERFDPAVGLKLDRSKSLDAVGVRFSSWQLGERKTRNWVLAGDPKKLDSALRINAGDQNLTDDLDDSTIFVAKTKAKEYRWSVGDYLLMTAKNKKHKLRISGIFQDLGLVQLNGPEFLITVPQFKKTFSAERQRDIAVFVRAEDGVSNARARATIDVILADTPFLQVQDQADIKDEVENNFQQLLSMLFGLLSLSLFVALLGIVITLALSVFERTREIGLLRAIGMTRWQVRRMVAGEAIMIALVGAALGLLLGLSMGWAGVQALHKYDIQFAMPIGLVIALIVVGVVAGILAAIYPAQRAARLKILEAITTE